MDISLISDTEMHALNAHYRGKDRPTDVISFALDDEPAPGEISAGGGFDFEAMFAGAPHMLGEISISIQTAAAQAAERGHSLQEESAFLAVHGALHLLGYDHDTAVRRRAMWKWQAQVMAALAPRLT